MMPPAAMDPAKPAQRDDNKAGAGRHGRSAAPAEPEPWHAPVATDALLGELAEAIGRHVIMGDHAIDAVALWALHTWVFERFEHSPRLAITSPERGCGKSTLMEVLQALARRPVRADNITTAALFRAVEEWRPTLLIDEADTFLRDNEELRGILNSGFAALGEVIRTVELKGNHVPMRFGTFAPVAIACIGALPDTLASRAVPIAMQRAGALGRPVKLREPGARERLRDLARKAARWARDNREKLNPNPDLPEALGDREGDISVPLIAIADLAGGGWPERARAALMLFGAGKADGDGASIGTLLLGDIRAIFEDAPGDWKASHDLCSELAAMEERPWAEWGRMHKPITTHALARLLKPYGITPDKVRLGGVAGTRGYAREAFRDAWARYLEAQKAPDPPSPPFKAPQAPQPQKSAGFSPFQSATAGLACGGLESRKTQGNQGLGTCGTLAGGEGPMGAGAWRLSDAPGPDARGHGTRPAPACGAGGGGRCGAHRPSRHHGAGSRRAGR